MINQKHTGEASLLKPALSHQIIHPETVKKFFR